MVREINVNELTENIREMCIQANYYLAPDMDACMRQAAETEKSELGTKILNQLLENLEIADGEQIPICQDTGMAVIFMEIGQDVHFIGGNFEEAVNEGVRQGYRDGYLRKSVVNDPLIRENTKDNTPRNKCLYRLKKNIYCRPFQGCPIIRCIIPQMGTAYNIAC